MPKRFIGMSPASKRIKDDRDWLEKHLRPLITKGRELQSEDTQLPASPSVYEQGPWTGLKLILVRYYMPGYLNILARRGNVAYIDLFAGPGLDLIGNNRVPVTGSPLLPFVLEGTQYTFASLVFCDTDLQYVSALKIRLSRLGARDISVVRHADANDFVEQLPDILAERDIGHSLVFIDPEGMEFKFEALSRLVDTVDCDVIVNFPSAGLQRNLSRPDDRTSSTIRAFLGLKDGQPLPTNEEDALRLYRGKLADLGKDVSTEIAVTAGNIPFHYHLIPAVRRTRGGSKWFQILIQAKGRIERLGGDVLDVVAEQIEGRQRTIDSTEN